MLLLRFWNPTLIVLMMLPLLAGCFGRGDSAAIDDTPVTLRYITFQGADLAEEALIERFTSEHPNVTFEVETYSQFPENYLKSESPPDLMFITPGNLLASAIEQGLLTDITDVWQESALAESYPPSLYRLSETDGKQYFLPTGYGWYGFFYNKEIFDQFGLEPPATWDELMVVADTLMVNGVTPFVLPGDDPWLTLLWFDYLNLRLNGAEFHQALASGQAQYYDARVQDVLGMWVRLLEGDYVMEDMATTDGFDAWMALIQGDEGKLSTEKAAMTLVGSNVIADVPELFRNELGFFPFPEINPNVPTSEIVLPIGYMLPANAENRLAAMSYLAFLGSESAADVLVTQANLGGTTVPVNIGDTNDLADHLVDVAQTITKADSLHPAYFFNVPLSMQQELGRIVARVVRDIDRENSVNLDELMQEMDSARLKQQ
ncbi:MAG: extracellular solute-binding protein [Caldilineaceae bacterium]|nr:extracellular solute-binding protein [Caldilineaceae bacterium]